MSARCSAAPITIRLFGSIVIEHAGRTLGPRDFGGSRPKQVLEILLAARGRPVPVDRIAELLWGERLPHNFAASIQTFISTLRRHLCVDQTCARELVVTEPAAYRFAVEKATIDITASTSCWRVPDAPQPTPPGDRWRMPWRSLQTRS